MKNTTITARDARALDPWAFPLVPGFAEATGRDLRTKAQPVQHLPQAALSVCGCCAMDGDQTVFCNGFWIRRVRHADGVEAWHVDGARWMAGPTSPLSAVSFVSFSEAACHAGELRLGPYTLVWAFQPLWRP